MTFFSILFVLILVLVPVVYVRQTIKELKRLTFNLQKIEDEKEEEWI